jgi:hypothetical protein
MRLAPMAAAVWLWMCTMSAVAEAQAGVDSIPTKLAGARTVVGVVYDTTGNFIEGAEVRIVALQLRAVSGPDGRYLFTDVKPGTYDVSARRIGYLPQVRPVVVGPDGGSINFGLVPFARGLPAVVVAAELGGLSGVVGDTAYLIVPGAEISVLAANGRAVTDSAGTFHIDLKPGTYMVRISRPGFATQMTSVTIPQDKGRRINVWLSPSSRAATIVENLRATQLAERLVVRNPVWSKIYSHEDIERLGFSNLTEVATHGAVRRMNESCMASLDGGPNSAPLWSLSAAELEFVEVSMEKPAKGGVKSITGGGKSVGRDAPETSKDCPATVIAWLRK